jgi:NADPH:quinone reductase-like Zn-dependent oxidoreductase
MEAATMNASDFLYVTDQYFITAPTPSDVGAEGVGRVTAVGPGVDEALLGVRVVLLPTYRFGTWATHVVAPTSDVVVAPDGVDALQLAMVGINPMTALRLLRDFGDPGGEVAGGFAVVNSSSVTPLRESVQFFALASRSASWTSACG